VALYFRSRVTVGRLRVRWSVAALRLHLGELGAVGELGEMGSEWGSLTAGS